MKLIYFISLFILISIYSSVNAQLCPNCLKENESCNIDKNSLDTCESGTSCRNISNGGGYICISYLEEGEKCGPETGQCIPGKRCLEDVNGIYRCLDYSFSNVGEECTLDSDCSTYELNCIKGVCKLNATKTCLYDDGNCQYDEYCSCPSTDCYCKPIKTEGESCNTDQECLGNLDCILSICTKLKLLTIGSICRKSSECDYNNGLYCPNGTCQEFVEPKSTSCNPNSTSTNQCPEFQSCSCSDGTCYQTSVYPPQTYLFTKKDLVQCAYDNGCSVAYDFNVFSSKSCVKKNCRKLMCEFRSQTPFKGKQKGDDCGREAYFIDLLCNSSFKITQSIASLLIISFISFVLIFQN
ncbi:hypothetical protein RB653_009382 [Dictyostelium firmibasis]|uniref:Dickkopf N-terminal cysteine-rich domain-containing protein n=1 Tax=Dictyostelium firmibasis TaxID=79012 RepID=A0AAN7YV75_9MYCE